MILEILLAERNLIDPATDGVVQNAGHKKTFHITRFDVQLTRDEFDLDPRVRLDQLDQDLYRDQHPFKARS